jgi:hypothetical protein
VAHVEAAWLLNKEETAELVQELVDLSLKELRIHARDLAISGYSKMNKLTLIEAIQQG